MAPVPGTRPRHVGRHTRSQPNTGRPWQVLYTENMLPESSRRAPRYVYRLHTGQRTRALQRLAFILNPAPLQQTIVSSLFQHIDRSDYPALRAVNQLLSNPRWPVWNPYRDPVSAAHPMPVCSIPVRCEDDEQYLDNIAVPALHQSDPTTRTDILWLTQQGPTLPCRHSQRDILNKGIEFYTCHMSAARIFYNLNSERPANILIRASPPRHFIDRVRHNRKWVCSQCAHQAWIRFDWMRNNSNVLWPFCRPCSLRKRNVFFSFCDCRRFDVLNGDESNNMCSTCRRSLRNAADRRADLSGQNMIRPSRGGWHVNDNSIDDRNRCRRDCWKNYQAIVDSWQGLDNDQREALIWRQCLVCQGFVGKRFGKLPMPTNCM